MDFFKNNKNKIKELIIILIILILIYIIKPSCPFKLLTGLDCTCCGTIRMISSLFKLNFQQAFLLNPYMLIIGPFILITILDGIFFPNCRQKFRLVFYIFYLILGIMFFILRNFVF